MNNETMLLLEKQFDTAFAAPDGIQKLRELILTLAMQGKLVPQDPNDQPASELLKAIEVEKQRLVKEKKIKQTKLLPEIKKEEAPCRLPNGWEWVRIPDCYYGIGNKTNQIQTKDYLEFGAYPVIDQGKAFIAGYSNDPSKLIEITQPVVIFGDHTRNIKFIDFNFVIGADGVKVLCPYEGIFSRYLYHAIQSYDLTSRGYARHFKVLNEKLFPLPPLAEQRRIVAKIDQLMARCDELEKLRSDRDQKLITVHTAAIARLLTAKDNDDFSIAWQFITQHFGELYSVKETVAELRKTILQLAVMGKLVSQDLNDEPASELLKAIEIEKQRLVKEGKIKKSKLVPEFKPEEIPYEIPKNWKWSNIQNISLKVTDGEHITPQRSVSGYYLLSARNVTNNGIKLDDVDYVPTEEYERIRKRCDPEIGDILVSCSGSVGRIAIVDADDYVMVRSVALIKHEHNFLMSSFLANALKSPIVQSQIVDKSRTTAQSNLFLGKINEILIPIPPLAEQHRIVAKVDQLMALCDRLEDAIATAQAKQTDLLNAVMAQV